MRYRHEHCSYGRGGYDRFSITGLYNGPYNGVYNAPQEVYYVRYDNCRQCLVFRNCGNPGRTFQICLAGNLVDRSVNDNWLEFKFANPNAVLVASKNLDLENFELSELHGKGLRVYTK